MAWYDDIFSPAGSQTFDEAQANTQRLQQQLAQQDAQRVANGTISQQELAQNNALIGEQLQSPGLGGAAAFFPALFGANTSGADPTTNDGNGVGTLVKDIIVLALIGGAIYLFFKLGGINQIKKLAGL